jgi:hypothetical protein
LVEDINQALGEDAVGRLQPFLIRSDLEAILAMTLADALDQVAELRARLDELSAGT